MKKILLAASVLIMVSAASGLIAAEAHVPENAANSSDAVVHGTVSNIADSGEVAEHHPVVIDVIDVFKGNISSETVIVQVKGTERMDISTAADFTEGEEVVAMLQEEDGRYYMTSGYATKYEVGNDSIELLGPEQKNITLQEMESIVENTTATPDPDVQRSEDQTVKDAENGAVEGLIQALGIVFNWLPF